MPACFLPRLRCGLVLKLLLRLLVLGIMIGALGCQRSYISSSDPDYPLGPKPASQLTFWKKDSQLESLKRFASKQRQQVNK